MRAILAVLLALGCTPAMGQAIGGGGIPQPSQPFAFIAAASNNLTALATSGSHAVFGAQCQSIASAGAMWLKFYNVAPTMGTTAAIDEIEIPAASSNSGAGFILPLALGVYYPAGLWVALTGGQSLTDNTSVAAGAANCTVYWR
jgi:hypothetical protein